MFGRFFLFCLGNFGRNDAIGKVRFGMWSPQNWITILYGCFYRLTLNCHKVNNDLMAFKNDHLMGLLEDIKLQS